MSDSTVTPTGTPQSLSLAELADRVGDELGVSGWSTITQETIDAFAEATGDRQWIHTDPGRAASTPFGGTIAHGYYTLALAPTLLEQIVDLSGFAMAMNYGIDRLRFVAPVPVDSRVRMRATLDDVQAKDGTGQLALTLTFEIEDAAKPACVANVLYRVMEGTS
ncbi:unannotated protein [freshwater metagenome]|uniref:Unannotated protein n=1 Tax=freshwater metagenome TaxID=449393 RepID=A0A6J7FJ00_9ZZZZ|nr:MaoC family dehydratase [Actinomycetota bacterium]